MATLAQLQARLAKVRQAQDDTVETGAQYSYSGSHSSTNLSLDQLAKQESRLIRRILRFKGYSERVRPNYSLADAGGVPEN